MTSTPSGAGDQPTATAEDATACPTGARFAGLFPLYVSPISEVGREWLSDPEIRELHGLVSDAAEGLVFLHGERSRPVPHRGAGGERKRQQVLSLTQRHLEDASRCWLGQRRALEPEESLRGL